MKFPHMFSITTLGRRPFWSETNELRAASQAWNLKLEVEEVGGWFVSVFQILRSLFLSPAFSLGSPLPRNLHEKTSSRWTAVLGMLSRTKAQTKPQCLRLPGKARLHFSVSEKSKQSQVQSERREGWKGVWARERWGREKNKNKRAQFKRQDGEKRGWALKSRLWLINMGHCFSFSVLKSHQGNSFMVDNNHTITGLPCKDVIQLSQVLRGRNFYKTN